MLLALLALVVIVSVGLAVSPLPGAKMIRGDIGMASADSSSSSVLDAANAARASKNRAELRVSRVAS